jgi:hypothetical protein
MMAIYLSIRKKEKKKIIHEIEHRKDRISPHTTLRDIPSGGK